MYQRTTAPRGVANSNCVPTDYGCFKQNQHMHFHVNLNAISKEIGFKTLATFQKLISIQTFPEVYLLPLCNMPISWFKQLDSACVPVVLLDMSIA